MQVNDVLAEAFGRLPALVRAAAEGLGPEQLHTPPAEGANTIAWLVWHLTRVQDDHLAVDRAWDPPVTLGVRLISVLNDDLQHAGQAAYVRGLLT